MKILTTKQRDHVMKLIQNEVSFFNGWLVDREAVELACFKAACKVENYIARKIKETHNESN